MRELIEICFHPQKYKEYELSEVFQYAEDDRKYEMVETKTHLDAEHNQVDMNNELSATIEQERQHEMTPKPSKFTEKDRIRAKLLANMNPLWVNYKLKKNVLKISN